METAAAGKASGLKPHTLKGLLWVLVGADAGRLLLLSLSGIYWDILWLLFGGPRTIACFPMVGGGGCLIAWYHTISTKGQKS